MITIFIENSRSGFVGLRHSSLRRRRRSQARDGQAVRQAERVRNQCWRSSDVRTSGQSCDRAGDTKLHGRTRHDAIDKTLADLPARSNVVVTRDGRNAMRLVVEESNDGFKTPDALAKSVMSKVNTPLQRGSDFMIAEIARPCSLPHGEAPCC